MLPMDPADVSFLIEVLAETDALFEPYRHDLINPVANGKHISAVVAKRHLYREAGLSIRGGGAAADRQEHSRRLARLEIAGLLTVVRRGHPLVRLTADAERELRELTNSHSIAQAFSYLQLIDLYANAGASNAGCVSEVLLAGKNSGDNISSREASDLAWYLTPLLTAGLIDASSDARGRVGYCLTPEGRAAIEAGCPPLPTYEIFDAEASKLHDDLFAKARSDLANLNPGKDTLPIQIPLSAGMWGDLPPYAVESNEQK